MSKLFLGGFLSILLCTSCKTSTTVRSLSENTAIEYTCPDGTKVASLALCPQNTTPVTVEALPFSYRGAIGQNNNTVSKSYWGAYDSGLLHAIYSHNSTTYGSTANANNKQDIVLMGWGVAAKTTSGNFMNLATQTIANDASGIGTSSGVTSWISMDSNYHPLILGTNVEKYYVNTDINNATDPYRSTTFASIITARTPTTANNDHNKLYTSVGYSNEKVHSQTLINGSSTAADILTRFNDMATAVTNATLFAYDFHTHFVDDAPKVREALITNGSAATFLSGHSSKYVLVLPVGDGVQNTSGTQYSTKIQKYLNNKAYDGNNYTSFAARVLANTDYLDRTKTSLTGSGTNSTPVVAIPIMNYGEFTGPGTNKKLEYYLPNTSYGAGVLRNISLSVPVSYNSIVYQYDASGNMRTGMAGFDANYGTGGSPLISTDRQASAILTALIGSIQSTQSVVARDALRQLAYQSTPRYGKDTGTEYTSGALTTTTQTHGSGTTSEYLLPNLIVVQKSNVANLINATAAETDQGNAAISGITSNSSAADIGTQVSKITSHDVIVKDGSSIIAMNDIWVGKVMDSGTVDRIISSAVTNPPHDYNDNPQYTGYYFCYASETDAACINPNKRIASNVFGFGVVNYRLFAGQTLALESVVRNQGASNSLSSMANTGILTSAAFGDSVARNAMAINVKGQNFAGESWNESRDGRERVAYNTYNSPFNSMLVSNAFQSQNSIKSYSFDIGGNAFSANITGRNITASQHNSVLAQSRFNDLEVAGYQARNAYGVIADSASQAGKFSNVAYSGNMLGIDFAVRSNFRPGLDTDKVSAVQTNVLESASIFYNPYVALTSNQFDAKAFTVGKMFSNNIKLGISTTFGRANFSGNSLYYNRESHSPNLTQTFSLSHNKNGNMIGFDTGFLRESQTLLGTYSSGAFALGSNNTTAFVKTNFSQKIYGNTSLIGSVSFGRTTANQVQNSLFTNVTPLLSRSFIVGLKQDILGGSFAVTYSQPLAIISGKAYFEGANGMQTISLTPSAQEQDFGISFSKQGKKSRTSLQAAYILNQNNLNVKPTVGLFATWTREVK